VTTGAGDDEVHAGVDTDTITTGAGNDHIHIEGGTDTITAGTGNDTMYIDFTEAKNVVVTSAFAGTAAAGYAGNINGIGITTFAGVENFQIVSGKFGDTLWTVGGDDIVDGGAGNDIVILGGGKDVGIYNMKQNDSAKDIYKGGDGIDTLTLEFTQEEWASEIVQTDIANYLEFQERFTGEANSEAFTFKAFGLNASEFENLRVTVGGEEIDPTAVQGETFSFGNNARGNRVDGGEGDDDISYGNNARVNRVNGGEGDDDISFGNNAPGNRVDGGEGADDISFGNNASGNEVKGGAGADTFIFGDNALNMKIDLGDGDQDSVTFEGSVFNTTIANWESGTDAKVDVFNFDVLAWDLEIEDGNAILQTGDGQSLTFTGILDTDLGVSDFLM
jgi:hypothetical protein